MDIDSDSTHLIPVVAMARGYSRRNSDVIIEVGAICIITYSTALMKNASQ